MVHIRHLFFVMQLISRAGQSHPRLYRNMVLIIEVICDEDVEIIERFAFFRYRSLRRVIMRGVIVVEQFAFNECEAEKDEFGCKRESGE